MCLWEELSLIDNLIGARKRENTMSKTIKEQTYYESTYFSEKDPNDDRCTLMTRHYSMYSTPGGNVLTSVHMDATEYPNEDAMVEDIKARGMQELSNEADGNPQYVPAEYKSSGLRRTR